MIFIYLKNEYFLKNQDKVRRFVEKECIDNGIIGKFKWCNLLD